MKKMAEFSQLIAKAWELDMCQERKGRKGEREKTGKNAFLSILVPPNSDGLFSRSWLKS